MARVFVSYRRDDAEGYAVGLHEALTRALGPDSVFVDVHGIRAGQNFEEALRATLDDADTVIVPICRVVRTMKTRIALTDRGFVAENAR